MKDLPSRLIIYATGGPQGTVTFDSADEGKNTELTHANFSLGLAARARVVCKAAPAPASAGADLFKNERRLIVGMINVLGFPTV